jgi:streptogramin lyase
VPAEVSREIGGIMSRLRSWIFVSLALVIFPLDGPMFGATRPTAAQRCAAAKIAAAAKKSRADLACRAKGARAGGPPDSACLLKAQLAFDTAFSRAERPGGCVASGDAGNVAVAIDHGVADLTADATGQCTAGCVEGCRGSFETCRWSGQACGCGFSLNSCVIECSLLGTSGFCANAGDVCDLGTCSCVAGSRSSACDAHKLEATGQELRAELLCQARATKSGGAVDPACIMRAETTFGHAFDTAEKAGGCVVTGNAFGVEDAIIPWVNGIANVGGLGCGELLGERPTGDVAAPAFMGMAVDGSGNVLITEPDHNAFVEFEPNGTTRTSFGPSGFVDPESIATDRNGNVFVTGPDMDLIYKFDNDLAVVTSWRTVSPPFILNIVHDIATDANGNLYVVGEGADDRGQPIGFVQKYDNDGVFLTQFGTGALNEPRALAVGADGRSFVADYGTRIVEFGSDGIFMDNWYPLETVDRMAVDPCGNVLITNNNGQGAIAKYAADGRFISTWSASAPGDTGPAMPWGIAVDGSGNILTIDPDNAAIKKFGCACTP